MEMYKKIAGITTKAEGRAVANEMLDRFGPLPEEAASLLALADIRIIAKRLGVASLKEKKGVVTVDFARVASVKVESLVRLVQESQGQVTLDPHNPNLILMKCGNVGLKEKSEFIRKNLERLTA
jgi:transcription-repair coupling factor (superfamily II helicase)